MNSKRFQSLDTFLMSSVVFQSFREREREREEEERKRKSIENNSKKLIGNKVMFNTGGGGGNSVILLSPGVN